VWQQLWCGVVHASGAGGARSLLLLQQLLYAVGAVVPRAPPVALMHASPAAPCVRAPCAAPARMPRAVSHRLYCHMTMTTAGHQHQRHQKTGLQQQETAR
jgi:hypothetical protein